MNDTHYTPGWKYFLRMILGFLLAIGFFFFWYGIKMGLALHIVLGSLSIVLGITHIVIALKKSRRY